MTIPEIRIQCLILADPKTQNADVSSWINRASQLEAYVCEGQSDEAPTKRRGRPPKVQAENSVYAEPVADSAA